MPFSHQCNAWCVGPRHADVVLMSHSIELESDVLAIVGQAYASQLGRQIVSARLATEAAKNPLVEYAKKHGVLYSDGRVSLPSNAELASARTWLIRFEEAPQLSPLGEFFASAYAEAREDGTIMPPLSRDEIWRDDA